MIFDATPGGPAASSYVTVADADSYFDDRLGASAWSAADVATKEKALKAATARLEQERFVGCRASSSQRLAWPRYDVTLDGRLVDTTTVPAPVQNAACEVALALLAAGTTKDVNADSGLEGFEHLSVGSVDITPRQNAPAPGSLPVAALRWLRGLLVTSTGVTKLVRG